MINNNNSLTVMVPAYNEEDLLEKTIENAVYILENKLKLNYEILLYNDGSTDKTGEIAEKLSKKYNTVRVFHNDGNIGQGYSIRSGINNATKNWFVIIPADFQFVFEDIEFFLKKCDDCDMVIGYISNPQIRGYIRRIMSYSFTLTLKLLFRIKIKYTNGMNLFKTETLRSIDIKVDSLAILGEMIVKLVRNGTAYTFSGFKMRKRIAGESEAVKLNQIKNAIFSTIKLFSDIYFKK